MEFGLRCDDNSAEQLKHKKRRLLGIVFSTFRENSLNNSSCFAKLLIEKAEPYNYRYNVWISLCKWGSPDSEGVREVLAVSKDKCLVC